MILWIDTNSARSVLDLRELARSAAAKGVQVAIHPQIYLERRRQLRAECRKEGKAFSPAAFDGFLHREGILVPAFVLDQDVAARWADEIDRRYPTTERWEAAKKATIGGQLRDDYEVLPGKVPMTTDWLVALLVEGDMAARIITQDGGEEWRELRQAEPRRALSWDQAMNWLASLPDAGA